MRILVTGAGGQLGSEVRRCLGTGHSELGPIDGAYRGAQVDCTSSSELDVSDARAVDTWFGAHGGYDLVINCAAATNVDGCEAEPVRAFAVNALGPMNLARAASRQGARLVHVSTDYVFLGEDATPRVEDDVPAPVSVYGRTKLAGEGLALAANPRTFVVRTAWLYGYKGKNFVKTMLRLAKDHPSVTVVDDQVGNPTSAADLAYQLLALALTDNYGIYHATCEGTCSWADFAEAIFGEFGVDCEVRCCSSEEYAEAHPASARRPHFSALENAHLKSTIGSDMRTWQEALTSYRRHLEQYTGQEE